MSETDAKSEFTHPFDPARFRLSEEYLVSHFDGEKKSEAAEARRHSNRPGFKFCQFPVLVLNALITQKANWTAFAVLMALYELWFTHPNHYNPVELTSRKLRRFGLSKGQKYRGLKSLEKSGQISVERRARKNPLVTLNWLPLRHARRA
jgi:hypothetical protein